MLVRCFDAKGLFAALRGLGRHYEPCHLPRMTNRQPPKNEALPKSSANAVETKEERLAKALRDNLRRRKAKKD